MEEVEVDLVLESSAIEEEEVGKEIMAIARVAPWTNKSSRTKKKRTIASQGNTFVL